VTPSGSFLDLVLRGQKRIEDARERAYDPRIHREEAPVVCGSVRYDEPVSCVIFIKGEQFGVAALPLAGFKIPP
jgi:hypothetical protein